jgi:hypothetical protein
MVCMTATLFLNGKPTGHVSVNDGVAVVSPGAAPLLSRLPVTLFPFLAPDRTMFALLGLAGRDIVTPLGVIRVEVR